MTAQSRRVRFELTVLEAEAMAAALDRVATASTDAWESFERKRGVGTARAALSRAVSNIRKEIQNA